MFEPGEAYVYSKESDQPDQTKQEEVSMFEQIAKRNFVARRGRNNRILFRSILSNVFSEKDDDQNNSFNAINNRGQNHYLEKYKKVWL